MSTIFFTCPHCDYKNKTFAVFVKHLNRSRPCELIKDGRVAVDLRLHAKRLSEERYSKKKHVCNDCGKKYTTPASLRMHKIRLHNFKPHNSSQQPPSQVLEFADDEEMDRALDELLNLAELPPTNSFGHEDIGHLLQESIAITVTDILKSDLLMEDKLVEIVRLVYNDPVYPWNKTAMFCASTQKVLIFQGGSYQEAKSQSSAQKVIKQRAVTVMQNPQSLDDDPLESFIQRIGQKNYDELKEFTYRIDLEDDPEFEEQTNNIVVKGLATC